jgi:hypothetical protein
MNAWPHPPPPKTTKGIGGPVVSHKNWVTRLLHGIIWPSSRFNPAMGGRREHVSNRHDQSPNIVAYIQLNAGWRPCEERGDVLLLQLTLFLPDIHHGRVFSLG